MPNSTITPETRATLERLAAKLCTACYGDPLLMQNAEGDKPCIHCRDDNNEPTGRRFWRLVERCPYPVEDDYNRNRYAKSSLHRDDDCSGCDGTGYVLAEHDLLEKLVSQLYAMGLFIDWAYRAERQPIRPSIEAALLSAAAAALEAAAQRETAGTAEG